MAAGSLGFLFLAGATIGLVSLLLPHPPRADVSGLFSNVALAFVAGLGLLLVRSRIRRWMLHGAVVIGALVITRAVVLSGEAVSFYSVWFIWVGLYAFYFFSRAAAAGHVAFVAGLYAATLVHEPPSSPVSRWLTTVATLIVAGVLIDALVRHARRETDVAARSAQSMVWVTELAHELAGLSDGAAARQALCEGAVRVTQASVGALWEMEVDGMSVRLSATSESATGRQLPAVPPADVMKAFSTGTPVMTGPIQPGASAGRDGVVAWHWQPVEHDRTVVAVLGLGWTDAGAGRDPAVPGLAHLLAAEIAVTLQRVKLLAELEKIARTDVLTRLPNRRAWREALPRELARADRSRAPLTVAMLDLDHFKHYNDTRGHHTGDQLLKQVAAIWTAHRRPVDLLARYGGEEFALALPDCPLDQALLIVERLRTGMPDGQSCSAGIACWDGSEDAIDLLGRADHALHRAKRAGRNQSAVAGCDEMTLKTPETDSRTSVSGSPL